MDWMTWVHGARPPATDTFGPGDEIRVWYRILEQGKERLGQFEGTVIRCRGSGPSRSFTIRRVTYGEGVERSFPFDAKIVSRIEVLRRGKVKRAKLYYLRAAVGKRRIASAESAASTGKPSDAKPDAAAPRHPDTAPERAESAGSLSTVPSRTEQAGAVRPAGSAVSPA